MDFVLSCCVLHEMNRQNLVKNGLLDKLDAVFDKCSIQGKAHFRTNIDLSVLPYFERESHRIQNFNNCLNNPKYQGCGKRLYKMTM